MTPCPHCDAASVVDEDGCCVHCGAPRDEETPTPKEGHVSDEKITTMDQAAAKRLTEAMREALAPVAERFGVEIKLGGGTVYEEGTFKPRVEVCTGNAEENTFRSLAPQLWPALEPDDYGRTFTLRGRTFTVAAINPKARKTPVLCDGDDGKRYRFDSQQILRALGRPFSVSGSGLEQVDAPR